MRTPTRWLMLGLVVVLSTPNAHGYFLDKERRFDVRARVYTQVGILTEDAREQEACLVPAPTAANPDRRVVTDACHRFGPGDLHQHRNFWNPEFDAKLTDFSERIRTVPGLSLLAPDEFKFRFAWWGFYDGVFDYLDDQWSDALRAQRVRLSESNEVRRETYSFNDHRKNVRKILGHDNRVNEAYFDYTKGRFFFRVGKQAISWGESDSIALLDIQNPFDLRVGAPGFFQDVDEARIPLWTARSTVKLVDSWSFLSGLFADMYLVPGPIDTTVPVDPSWFGMPFSPPGWTPGYDPQVAQASFLDLVGGHVVVAQRLPKHEWGESRWGVRLSGLLFRDYTTQVWFFRSYPAQPTPLLTGPPGGAELAFSGIQTLIDDRGNRVPICLDDAGNQVRKGVGARGRTPSGRACKWGAPVVTQLFRRLTSVAGIASTWFSPMVNGIIRTEAEYFLDEDAFVPSINLDPRVQIPGSGFGPNRIPKADYLRWTIGYDRFFFFRTVNPSNSIVVSSQWNGQWNVTSTVDGIDFRNRQAKPGKVVAGDPAAGLDGLKQPDTNWEDEKGLEHFFTIAFQTEYMHGRLTPRVVLGPLDPSGIFGFVVNVPFRITDSLILTPSFFAIEASRRTGLATFRDRDQFQIRLTYQLN
jgi:hypothetical protein